MKFCDNPWAGLLPKETVDKAEALYHRAEQEVAVGKRICPPLGSVFRALELTPPETCRCAIVGQDPYQTPHVANGLAFSVTGEKFQPSLRNIFKELSADIGCGIPSNGDLTRWAEQGVLLLNTSLTVYEDEANSHKKWGWQDVTGAILRACSSLPQPMVFFLWGRNAQAFADGTFTGDMMDNKLILKSSHPSPLGATKASDGVPAFIGSRPFSKANEFLSQHGAKPIDWTLP